MRSWTRSRKALSCSLVRGAFPESARRNRRERSILDIFVSPQAWQTDTAFVDQAVVKFMRGPTSKIVGRGTTEEGRLRKLLSENFSGSKVSARSQRSRRISSAVSGLSAATLKQNSVSIPRIAGETFCRAVASRPSDWKAERAGVR